MRTGVSPDGIDGESDHGDPDNDGASGHPPEDLDDVLGAAPCRVERRLDAAATG
ncbi:MAG: hypothetical protein ACHBNF_06170 [Chromatiales bacterium]